MYNTAKIRKYSIIIYDNYNFVILYTYIFIRLSSGGL